MKKTDPKLFHGSFRRFDDDNANDVNPFKHDLNLTNVDYVVSFFIGIFLVPIRIVLVTIVVLVGWIGAVVFTSDRLKNPEGIQNSKLRLKTYEILLKLLAWSSGFIVTLSGTVNPRFCWSTGLLIWKIWWIFDVLIN